MKKVVVVFLLCLIIFPHILWAQKSYSASAGEVIFSYGLVGTDSTTIKPFIRFSPVFNLQQQRHFDFSNHFGCYIGLGIRNIGLISHANYDIINVGTGNAINKEVTIKERSYSLGLPLALKFGKLDKGMYVALGGEAEMMFAYKRKIKDGDTKNKSGGWFGNNVNIFNPSVFLELKFHTGQYVRCKYYLLDFLNYKSITLIDGTTLPDYGKKSPLFYVSFGTVKKITPKKKKKASQETKTTTTYFKNEKKNSDSPQATFSVSSSTQ